MNRIAIILASLVAAILLPVVPASAEESDPLAECQDALAAQYVALKWWTEVADGHYDQVVIMRGELASAKANVEAAQAEVAVQRNRAEAFKAQVSRKDATIARLREQLAAARR